MIQIKGARTKLHHVGKDWCRRRTTWPIACPDGVTRCITIPNWRWGLWVPDYRPDAFTTGPFRQYVDNAWLYSQAFARHYDASAMLCDELIFTIELHHRRPYYWPANENVMPLSAETFLRVPKKPYNWKKGGFSLLFNRRAGNPIKSCASTACGRASV